MRCACILRERVECVYACSCMLIAGNAEYDEMVQIQATPRVFNHYGCVSPMFLMVRLR